MKDFENKKTTKIIVGAKTDPGMVRKHNEDTYLIDDKINLYLLADGMGGHRAGEVASQIAIDTVHDFILKSIKEDDIKTDLILNKSIYYANKAIQNKSNKDISYHGMGATIIAAWFPTNWDILWIVHVGDSRAYLLHEDKLTLLTEDHTIFNRLKKANLLPENPSKWPSKNILSQALGSSQIVVPDVNKYKINKQDRIMLCSDGVSNMINKKEILNYLEMLVHPQVICEEIIQAANTKGGKDNITVIIIQTNK